MSKISEREKKSTCSNCGREMTEGEFPIEKADRHGKQRFYCCADCASGIAWRRCESRVRYLDREED